MREVASPNRPCRWPPVIKGQHVRLRRYQAGDRYRFIAWNTCPWLRRCMDGPLTREAANALFARLQAQTPSLTQQAWAVEASDGRHVGHVFVSKEQTPGWRCPSAPALGVLLDRQAQRLGYAREACLLLMATYFRLGGDLIVGSVDCHNWASRRLMQAIGMRWEATLCDDVGPWLLFAAHRAAWAVPGLCWHS